MSDTPKTDKEIIRTYDGNWVDAEFARQLERDSNELDGLREIAKAAGRLVRAANVTPMTSTNGCGLAAIGKELATLEKLLREPK